MFVDIITKKERELQRSGIVMVPCRTYGAQGLVRRSLLIGIGGGVAPAPLPHHRTYSAYPAVSPDGSA